MRNWLYCILIAMTACSSSISTRAENDIFGSGENRDMQFSNGIYFTHRTHKKDTPEFIKKSADIIPSLSIKDGIVANRYSLGVGQEMHTPDDIGNRELQLNRNPFVGFLFFKLGKEEITHEYKKRSFLYMGVVGPWSFAGKTQREFHALFDMTNPRGWRNQIDNEFVFMHESGIEIRDLQIKYNTNKLEQSSGYKLKLGTWYTGLEFFLSHKFGQNYELFSTSQNKEFSWFLFNTPYIQAVLRDMTLDGNTFRNSHSVEKEPFVYGNEWGIQFEYNGYALKLYNKTQSKIFKEQDKRFHIWGGFSITKLFDI